MGVRDEWEKWSSQLSVQFKQLSLFDTWKIQVASVNEIWTHDLCDASVMLYQLSDKDTHLEAAQQQIDLLPTEWLHCSIRRWRIVPA